MKKHKQSEANHEIRLRHQARRLTEIGTNKNSIRLLRNLTIDGVQLSIRIDGKRRRARNMSRRMNSINDKMRVPKKVRVMLHAKSVQVARIIIYDKTGSNMKAREDEIKDTRERFGTI